MNMLFVPIAIFVLWWLMGRSNLSKELKSMLRLSFICTMIIYTCIIVVIFAFVFVQIVKSADDVGNGGGLCGNESPVSISVYHGAIEGYSGNDVNCKGNVEYSPIDGIVSFVGCDGYIGIHAINNRDNNNGHTLVGSNPCGMESTMLTINGNYQTVTLFHGCYDVNVGDELITGKSVIGKTCNYGNSTGEHTHVSYYKNNVNIDGYAFLSAGKKESYTARMSHYDVNQGGTNCQEPCNKTANGEYVSDWWNTGMACPSEFPMYTVISFNDREFTCVDRGGFIKCYSIGELDVAIQHQQALGYMLDEPVIAEESYCWFDTLIEGDVGIAPYGSFLQYEVIQ